MIRRELVLLAALCASCTGQERLPLPEVDGARSMLLVFADPSHEREGIFAIDLENAAIAPVALHEEDRLFVLSYPMTLAELGLEPGKIEIVTNAPDRPLPSGYSIHEAIAPERNVVEIENDAFVEFMGDVRLRGYLSPECEDRGGCFRLVRGEEYCMLPCTLPEVTAPDEPDPPEAPRFDACPAGWTASLGACTPPAIAGCLTGEAQFLGDAACTSVAGACAARFPTDLGGDVAYVDAAVVGPGSGTAADPYKRIADALASNRAAIAIAAGNYTEQLSITRAVEIAGACRDVRINGSMIVASANVVIRNLRIEGTLPVTVDGAATLSNVELSGVQRAARVRPGGSLTAESVLVEQGSRGFLSEGTLSLSRVRVAGGIGPGVSIVGGNAVLDDLFITDRTTNVSERGYGIEISGGSVAGERIFISETADHAILASGTGSEAELSFVVMRDRPGVWLVKHAIDVRNGASVKVDKLLVTDIGGVGVYATSATAEITDAVFSDIGRPAFFSRASGAITATRARIERPYAFGARVYTATLVFTDVSIDGVMLSRISGDGEQQGWDGYGIYGQAPERLALTRVGIRGALGNGMGIYGAATADFTDVRVADVVPRDAFFAYGMTLYNTPGTLRRVAIENIQGVGLDISGSDQPMVRANHVRIAGTTSAGFAPSVATVEGGPIEIDGATGSAIHFDRAVVSFSNVRLANTVRGNGAFVGTDNNMDYRESFFRIDGGRIENHPDGVCLALGWYGTIEAADTVLTRCGIGFDIVVVEEGRENVPEGIRFYRNERNVKLATEG